MLFSMFISKIYITRWYRSIGEWCQIDDYQDYKKKLTPHNDSKLQYGEKDETKKKAIFYNNKQTTALNTE